VNIRKSPDSFSVTPKLADDDTTREPRTEDDLTLTPRPFARGSKASFCRATLHHPRIRTNLAAGEHTRIFDFL